MNPFRRTIASAIVAFTACAPTTLEAQETPNAPLLPTTGGVETRLGVLELANGYPTAQTAQKVFDDIDYQRACQAYLWALPLMAMEQWQNEHLVKFGAGKCD